MYTGNNFAKGGEGECNIMYYHVIAMGEEWLYYRI